MFFICNGTHIKLYEISFKRKRIVRPSLRAISMKLTINKKKKHVLLLHRILSKLDQNYKHQGTFSVTPLRKEWFLLDRFSQNSLLFTDST